MFHVGDIVRCVDNRCWGLYGSYIRGIDTSTARSRKNKRYVVTSTRDYSDGSQQLWVRAMHGENIRGPYCHLRFTNETPFVMNDYDPNQMGDCDDDI